MKATAKCSACGHPNRADAWSCSRCRASVGAAAREGVALFRIGRASDNDILTPADAKQVARYQAEALVRNDGTVEFRDLGSANGTLLGGHLIDGIARIGPQTPVAFGSYDVEPALLAPLFVKVPKESRRDSIGPEKRQPRTPAVRRVRCRCGVIREVGVPCPSCGER